MTMTLATIQSAADQLIEEHPDWGAHTSITTIYEAILEKHGIEPPMTRSRIRVRVEQALRLLGEDPGDIER